MGGGGGPGLGGKLVAARETPGSNEVSFIDLRTTMLTRYTD
jgi:hypothetical protein